MYTKIIQRGILIAVGVLFIVPLAILAQEFPQVNTLYRSMTTKVWLTNTADAEITSLIVSPGEKFTINWATTGSSVGADGIIAPSTDDIVCINNWKQGDTRHTGSATGSITRSRTFRITCMGVGAGMKVVGTVTVGVADLIVESIDVNGLVSSNSTTAKPEDYVANREFELQASIKNIGNANVLPFISIVYLANTGKDMRPETLIDIDNRFVNGLKPGIVVKAPVFKMMGGLGQTLYFQACADDGNNLQEKNETNNCSSPVKGPYHFVAN